MATSESRIRVGKTPAELKQAILDNLYFAQGRIPALATTNDWCMAVALTVRDHMMNDWIEAFARDRKAPPKVVAYLSRGIPYRASAGKQSAERA